MVNPLGWLERTLSKGALAALEGATVGGASGALANPDDPASGAIMGAGTGAITGPIGYAAATGLGKGTPTVGGWLGLRPDRPGAILKGAQRSLLSRLGYDEAKLPELEARLRALHGAGVPATLADLSGENTLGLADVSVRTPGAARKKALEDLQARQDQQKGLVMDAVKAHVAPSTDVLGEQARLQKLKKTEADQQYGAARAAYPQLSSPELDDLYARAKAVGADKLANDVADARGDPRLPAANFIPQPGQAATPQLGLREWDLLKRGLDAKIQALGPRESTRAGALQDLRDQMVTELDKQTTDPQTGTSLYAAARNQFHDFSTTQEAIDAGRNFDKGTSDEVMANFNKLSPSDQEAFRVGVGRRVQDLIEDKKNGVGILNTVVQAKGPRLEQVLGPQDWQGLQQQLQPLFDIAHTNNRILGGSITQPRLAEEHGASGEGGVLERITEAPTATQGLLSVAASALGHDPHELHELRADKLTELLLNPNFHENLATLEGLQKRQNLDKLRARLGTAGKFGTAGLTAAGTAGMIALPDPAYVEPTNLNEQPPDLSGVLPTQPGDGRPTILPDQGPLPKAQGGRLRDSGYPDLARDSLAAEAFRLNNPEMRRHDDPGRFLDVPEIYRRADEAYRTLDELGQQNAAMQDTHALGWDPRNVEDVNSPFPVFGTDVYPPVRRWVGEHLGTPGVAALIGGKDVMDNSGLTHALSWALSNPQSVSEDLQGAGETLLNFGPLGWGGRVLRSPAARKLGALALASSLYGSLPAPEPPTAPGVRGGGI